MDIQDVDQDSPLSIASSIAGILTFVVAILATILVRVTYLRNSDDEYFRVKASLSWYKTESTWLAELVRAVGDRMDGPLSYQPEYQMYAFVMDDLLKLEQRLLEIVEETEERAGVGGRDVKERWALVPRSWGFTTGVAMAWLPVRTKALELVRQRDALTARVQFTQMSMISSRIRDLESRSKWRETRNEETLIRLEAQIAEQRNEIQRLKDVVYKFTNRRSSRQSVDIQALVEAMKVRRMSSSQQSPREMSPRQPELPGHERRSSAMSLKRSRSK